MPYTRAVLTRKVPLGAWVAVTLALGAMSFGACIAGTPTSLERITDQDAGEEPPILDDGGVPDDAGELPTSDPHAVLGTDPAHGPFLGGQRVLIHGKGFGPALRVWFGTAEVDPATVIPVDATRVQVAAPPGKAGSVDVTVQDTDDESTRRTLPEGYVYDTFYAEPDSGPVAGGVDIELIGLDTAWDASTVVKIDNKPCTSLTVDSPTALACTVPQGTPGAKVITITTGNEVLSVLDAYTYEDSDNGFKGGLSGAPLAGDLKVLVYNNFTGDPIPGAHAIAGTDIATAIVVDANSTGVALLSDPSLDKPTTVTVAARCFSPTTFVNVPVDTVTIYLDPVLSPECVSSGDPPLVGGKPQHIGTVTGELVWEGGTEFKKALWTNVPQPANANEAQAAYVFFASGDPTVAFTLPPESSRITPDTPGFIGYEYALSTSAGNRALYAVAGVEDRTKNPPLFTAYAFGVVQGVPLLPNEVTEAVYIHMYSELDQALNWQVTPPAIGAKGPDRMRSTVALMLGNDGYALLPAGSKIPLLPVSPTLSFVGVPALTGDLAGSFYISTARACTGPSLGAPLSVVGRLLATNTGSPVTVGDFVGLPTLTTPAVNGAWDGMGLGVSFPAGGLPLDLTVYDVLSGNGLMHWLVAVPGGSNTIALPSLDGFDLASIPAGPVTVAVYGARVADFDYANLRYRDLRSTGMQAYSLDYFAAHR